MANRIVELVGSLYGSSSIRTAKNGRPFVIGQVKSTNGLIRDVIAFGGNSYSLNSLKVGDYVKLQGSYVYGGKLNITAVEKLSGVKSKFVGSSCCNSLCDKKIESICVSSFSTSILRISDKNVKYIFGKGQMMSDGSSKDVSTVAFGPTAFALLRKVFDKNAEVELKGYWKNSAHYGKQFVVSSFSASDNKKKEVDKQKNSFADKLKYIKDCSQSSDDDKSKNNAEVFYCSNMKEYLLSAGRKANVSDLLEAESKTIKLMYKGGFSPESISDCLKKLSPVPYIYKANSMTADCMDVYASSVSNKLKQLNLQEIIDERNQAVADCKQDLKGSDKNCKNEYLLYRHEALDKGKSSLVADYNALYNLFDKYPLHEIKRTFLENSPCFVNSSDKLDNWMTKCVKSINEYKAKFAMKSYRNVNSSVQNSRKPVARPSGRVPKSNNREYSGR